MHNGHVHVPAVLVHTNMLAISVSAKAVIRPGHGQSKCICHRCHWAANHDAGRGMWYYAGPIEDVLS